MGRAESENLDEAFLAGAAVAADLLRTDPVSGGWTEPSALPEMSVGALACHLARQVTRVAELLVTPTTLPVLTSVDEHYARAAWVTASSLADPANDRHDDDAEASLSRAWMLDRLDDDLSRATRCLRNGSAQEIVPVPWQGWALRRHDFLHTRLLEIVVHSTDLAVSLTLPPPEFPEPAFAPVRDLLVRLAVRRHGQAAVVSALTRRERAKNISAF
ncbi:maleylpyruvate isomerase N-terminal domain-containing protein [Actinophytocola gossypii]|uniref:Maleylpyruvate isomerase N-terminal domain-containing protein n=1 Tax=Actinophytocola gossypii TaxID=2812003 RepID=A0ABT2JKF6_9PSEU|nr:maleylpyruvate isomerase N-terminal domain-containing protein [Actinophytocola gossypii]MCT2588191.1 maleylpyruvate isomerase N-terminal domain-containing protein [Actinophytocola gossypii]